MEVGLIRISHVNKKITSLRIRRISKIGILISSIATAILWLVSFYGLSIGAFVIQINEPKKSGKGISLFVDDDFKNPTSRIETTALNRADNITYTDIPKDVETKIGKNNDPNGNYFAFSFYLKNTGEDSIDYVATIKIDDVSKGADSAIRVMIIKDLGERKIYAKSQEQGPAVGQPEPGTIPFKDSKIIYYEENRNFKKGNLARYSIVIWLEGNDPECVDDILGGGVRLSMTFKVKD